MTQALAAQQITVNLPHKLYQRLANLAHQTNRALEDELLSVVAGSLPLDDELPFGLENELLQLRVLSDDVLWRIASSQLATNRAAKLERLHLKAQRQPLNPSEQNLEQSLIHEYERAMLIRARAARLLYERGFDVSALLQA